MVLMKKTTQHLRLILIGVQGVATISSNPNTRSTGAATISINPARHTSKASGRGGYNRYLKKKYNSGNSSQDQNGHVRKSHLII